MIDQASQLLGSDGCCVYRYDPQQQELEVAAASGASPCGGTICGGPDRRTHRPGARRPRARRGARAEQRAARCSPCRSSCAARPTASSRSRTARSARSTTSTCAWPPPSAVRSRWPSRTPASGTRSARRRRPPSARGWRATCTTPSRSRCSPRASRPRPSAAAGGRRSDEARDNVEDVERLARGALAEMRTLLMEMRPDTLAEASLATLHRAARRGHRGRLARDRPRRAARQRAAAPGRQRRALPHRPGGPAEREPPFRRDRGVGYARHDGGRGPPLRARQRARVRRGEGDAGALRARDDARARGGRRASRSPSRARRAPAPR